MMPELKNIHLLADIVSEDDLKKMEYAAVDHRRYSNITFKVIEVASKKVTIQVSQGKSSATNYQDKKRLVEIVHETFDRFFEGYKINVGAIPYKESPVSIVDAKWIEKQMAGLHIGVKQIVEDTGIDKTQTIAYVNGVRPLSQTVKSMFYYYFLAKSCAS